MNKCRICGKYLPCSDPKHGWQCRDCLNVYRRKWAKERRALGFHPGGPHDKEQRKKYYKEYFKRPDVKKRTAELVKKYKNDPILKMRYLARQITIRAITAGKIKRGACSICGLENAEAHHIDYYRPLKVVWMCRKHHMELHEREANRARAQWRIRP